MIWYRKSAAFGDPEAQANIGFFYSMGLQASRRM